MKSLGVVLMCLSLFVLAAAAPGECQHQRVVVSNQQAYATPVYAATYIPYALPVYNVSYQPAAGMPDEALRQEVLKLRQEILTLSKQIAAATAGGPAPGPSPVTVKAPAPIPRGLAVLRGRCAACHDVTTAKKGGDRILLKEGQFLDTNENVSHVLEQIDGGTMPKAGPPLTDREKYDVVWFLTTKVEPATAKGEAPKGEALDKGELKKQ